MFKKNLSHDDNAMTPQHTTDNRSKTNRTKSKSYGQNLIQSIPCITVHRLNSTQIHLGTGYPSKTLFITQYIILQSTHQIQQKHRTSASIETTTIHSKSTHHVVL